MASVAIFPGREGKISSAVSASHEILKAAVRPGDRVVDATCGNGRDTLLLARLVAPSGHVWAFDIQDQALAATRTLLEQSGLQDVVELVHAGHEEMGLHLEGSVRAIVFNLGYLPGGDKARITLPITTVAALDQCRHLLCAGGVVVVVVYPGHEGGAEEAAAVDSWMDALPRGEWRVRMWRPPQRDPRAAYMLAAEKL